MEARMPITKSIGQEVVLELRKITTGHAVAFAVAVASSMYHPSESNCPIGLSAAFEAEDDGAR